LRILALETDAWIRQERTLSRVGPSMEGTSGRRNALSFAGGRVRRPFTAWLRESGVSPGEPVDIPQLRGILGGGFSSPRRKQACDRRCPSQSGWGEGSTASDRAGKKPRIGDYTGPWPVKSRLAELRKEARPPAVRAALEATPARCAGLDRSGGCARNSFRLQKSASGARSSRPRVNSP